MRVSVRPQVEGELHRFPAIGRLRDHLEAGSLQQRLQDPGRIRVWSAASRMRIGFMRDQGMRFQSLCGLAPARLP